MSDIFQAASDAGPPSSSAHPPRPWNYEATVSQVEAIIERIETGELELAQVFDQFAVAVEHLRQCEAYLNHHQAQIELLVETILEEDF